MKNRKKVKGIGWRIVVFPLTMVWLEYYFHMETFGDIDGKSVYSFVFAIVFGMLIALLTCIFRNRGNKIIAYIFVSATTLVYIAQVLYYYIFGTFFGFFSLKGAGDAFQFRKEVFLAIKMNIGGIVGMLIPLICLIVVGFFFLSYERPQKTKMVILGTTLVMAVVGSVLSLNIGGRELLSAYNLFHRTFVMNVSMKRLGVVTTMGRDIQINLFGGGEISNQSFNENYITINDIDEDGFEPQIDESLDLEEIYNGAEDSEIKAITAYVSNRKPTYKNEYTGMYEGYNLIYINAESLSPYVVREDWMPMLYKMMHEGFVFNNYYQPTWNKSTIDAEYTNCLSQYPSPNRWSLLETVSTYQPYALGNMLSAKGYDCKAFHDYDFRYYDRSVTHSNMGYDFEAVGYGLNLPSQDKYYSDLEMMQESYNEFTKTEPFHAYFMTYSGHLPYTYKGNPISEKNRTEAERLTEGLPYNDRVRAYIAAQLELEYALEYLVERLEEDDLLDHTLFVISPDHYPYEMHTGDYDVLAQDTVLESEFATYQSCLAIWNSQIKEPIVIDKICAGIDILPTVLNLMGMKYDSRLLMGRDILYKEDGYVSFEDYSYITPYIECDAKNDYVKEREENVNIAKKETVIDLNKIEQMYKISEKMLEKDYFGYIYKKDGKK